MYRRIVRAKTGYVMVVLLVVVAIIMILTLSQIDFSTQATTTTLNTATNQIEESNKRNFGVTDADIEAARQGDNPDGPVAEDGGGDSDEGKKDHTENMSLAELFANPEVIAEREAKKQAEANAQAAGSQPAQQGIPGTVQAARDMQSQLNTQAMNKDLMMWKMKYPGMKVTIDNLKQTGFRFPIVRPNQEIIVVKDQLWIIDK